MKTIQYGFLVFRQSDEVSVDGMDVHAAAYQQLNHIIPMYNHTWDIHGIYSEVVLNYSNSMSLFNTNKM